MIKFSDLKTGVEPAFSTAKTVATLHLDHEAAVVPALRSLSNYYKEFDPEHCMQLILRGKKAGCLSIGTVHKLSMQFAGHGDSDQGGLPGFPDFSLILFQCPKDDTELAWAVTPPICETHHVRMERV
jgi:hypothetical protein